MFLLFFYSLVMTLCQDSGQVESSSPESHVLFDESFPPTTFIKVPFYELTNRTGKWNEPDYSTKSISTEDPSAKVSYTYYGTKCNVFAYKGRDKGVLNIKIDELLGVDSIDLYEDTDEDILTDIFTTIDGSMLVGQHKIQIWYNDTRKGKPINVAHIYFLPYNISHYRHNFCQGKTDALCETDGYLQLTSDRATTVNFYGTRFFITGIHGGQVNGDMTITIDGKTVTTLTKPEARPGLGDNFELGVLIYSSDVFELKDHEVTIKCLSDNLGLVSFFFSPQPLNAVYVSLTDITPLYAQKIDDSYYQTSTQYASFSFHMYGTRIWAMGEIFPEDDFYDIFYQYTNAFPNGNFSTQLPTKPKKK